MVDLETMGNESGSAIVSIAAIYFNLYTGEIGEHFYEIVDLKSCLDIGLKINASTLYWWLKQSEEARLEISPDERTSINEALVKFSNFCGPKVEIWGNSARFDLGILQNAYRSSGMEIPWDFRKERCVRTLVSLHPRVREEWVFEGTKHHPLHDCKNQIGYVCKTYSILKNLKS